MAIKVEALRVGSRIVHFGRPAPVKDFDGARLYRIACQGRNARFYVRAAENQSQPVTCQRCAGKRGEDEEPPAEVREAWEADNHARAREYGE